MVETWFDTKFKLKAQGPPEFESGFAVDLLHAMRDILNFSIEARVVEATGIPLADGSWSGQIGEVLAGRADLAITSTVQVGRRIGVVGFNVETNPIE